MEISVFMKGISIVALLSFAMYLSGQKISSPSSLISSVSIHGVVKDSLASSTIQGATVALYVNGSSTPTQGVFTDSIGHFSFSAKNVASAVVKVSYVGYKDRSYSISQNLLRAGNVNLGNVNLASTGVHLNTVTVTTNVPEVVVKEDTIEYNAAAYKVPQNAVVEDLLKRLPGVEVDKNGKITTTSGKEVTRVYVDGKRFFGDDPKMATKNLTADIVDKVQVVDKKSDLAILTGVDDDDSETVINITIKKGMKKGVMGNINAGIGRFVDNDVTTDPRYNVSGMLNRFRDNSQFSVILNANNVNNRTSTDNGNNVRSRDGGSSSGNSITTSNNVGVNWANDFSDKFKLETSTSFNYSDDYSNSNSYSENLVLADSGAKYVSSLSTGNSYSNNFAAEARMEYKMDKNTTVRVAANFSYNASNSNTLSSSQSESSDSTLINESNADNKLKSDGTTVRLQMDASRKLSDKGRQLSFSGIYNTNNSSGTGYTDSKTIIYTDTSLNTLLNQRYNSGSNRGSYSLRTDYVEPLSKNNFLNFSYNVQFNNTLNKKITYDYDSISGLYDELDPDYTRNSETHIINQSLRAAIRGQYTKYTYSVGVNVVPMHTSSKTYIKDWFGSGNDSILNVYKGRTTINFAPQLEFVYRFDAKSKLTTAKDSLNNQQSQDGNQRGAGGPGGFNGRRGGSRNSLRIRYEGRTTQPSVTQLDPTPDNTNPLNITSGNPNLLPTFTHQINLEYSKFNVNNQSSINATARTSIIKNGIVNYTTYVDSTGGKYTKPVNVNGSWNTNAGLMLARPLGQNNRFRLSSTSNLTYTNQVGFTKVDSISAKNTTRTLGLNQGINLSFTNDWFYGQLRGQVKYSKTTYTAGTVADRESYVYTLSYNTQITMPYSWTLSSDVSYTANRGLSSGYNKDQVLWNAELGKSVLQKGYVSLKITDILRQGLNVSRTVSSETITDTQYTALTSYVMLSFTYRFANMGRGNRNRGINMGGFGRMGGGGPGPGGPPM